MEKAGKILPWEVPISKKIVIQNCDKIGPLTYTTHKN